MVEQSFRWPDILVFVGVFVISLAIGIYHACTGGKQRTTSEYFQSHRNLQFIATGISIMVSFMSSVTILGIPAEIYTKGIAFILWLLGSTLGKVITAFVVVPLLYPLKLVSTYEYLERRFQSKVARSLGSLLNIISMNLYSGVIIYGTSTAIEAASDIPSWVSIIVIGLLTTIYTSVGGIRAVIWTDVFQSIIILVGVLAILIQGIIVQGGPSRIWHQGYEGGRLGFGRIFNMDPRERHTVWGLIIGSAILAIGAIGISQANVQRFSSVSTLRKAKVSIFVSLPGFIVVGTCAVYIGLILYSYFLDKGCDPLSSGTAKNPNQLVVIFVTEVFRFMPGFTGLFLAAVCSAALSTISSLLNALAALTWEDLCKERYKHMAKRNQAIMVKCFVVLYGIVMTAVAFLAMTMGGTVIQVVLIFNGALLGPLLGMFVLGAFSSRTNWIGACVGAVVGLGLCIWISVGRFTIPAWPSLPPGPITNCSLSSNASMSAYGMNGQFVDNDYVIQNITTAKPYVTPPTSLLEPLYRISYLWYTSIGMFTTVVIGVAVSLITGSRSAEEIPPELLIFPLENITTALPVFIRKVFTCGITSSSENVRNHNDCEDMTGTDQARHLLHSSPSKESSSVVGLDRCLADAEFHRPPTPGQNAYNAITTC